MTTMTIPTSAKAPTRTAAPPQLAGLCTTCVHAPGCALRSRSEGGVWHCEEFDVGTLAAQRSAPPAAPLPPVTAPAARGLCSNCEVASTCALPRPASGVWHCEEHR